MLTFIMSITIIKGVFLGLFLFLFLYHFLVFLGRKHDLSNLYYSLYNLGFALIFIVRNIIDYKQTEFLTHFANSSFIILTYFTSTFLVLFSTIVYKAKKYKLLFYLHVVFSILSIIYFILYLIFKNVIFLRLFLISLGIYGIFFVSNLFINYKNIIKLRNKKNNNLLKSFLENKKQFIIFIGYFFLMVFLCFYAFFLAVTLFKIVLSILVYSVVIIQSLIFAFALTYSFNEEHFLLQKRELELNELNKNLEKKVKERTKELKEEKDNKTQYFINISHLIKTPLTLISNYLSIAIVAGRKLEKGIRLKWKNNYKELTECFRILSENIDEITKNIINFMDFEKLQNNQIFYNHNFTCNFSSILESKKEIFKGYAENKNLEMNFKIEKNILIKIDPAALVRIINNLIDNAIKYTKKGKIEVVLEKQDDEIIFSVKDTGVGIKKDKLNNLFKPYYQLTHDKRNIQGIGMGLNITKKIIDELNGKIYVNSEYEKGTEFKTFIPYYADLSSPEIVENINIAYDKYSREIHPIKKIKKDDLNDVFHNKSYTVLIVEDKIDMLILLKNTFQIEYNIIIAKNGEEAVGKMESLKASDKYPDLIISDIMMDKMDGYELLSELQKDENYKTIPFIFLTAKTNTIDKLKGLKMGAIHYIQKPFYIEELKATINSILEQKGKRDRYVFLKEDQIKTQNLPWVFNKFNLSDREIEVMKLFIKGKENKEIALSLDISDDTVRAHMKNIYKKTKTRNRFELNNLLYKYTIGR